ncbi:MAG: hypothetical protein QOJ64_735 [Acidobacteriota bacterium]|nr:hypothetical protein [Acidobacteriota bacterium]
MVSILQICLYLALSLSTDKADWLFYFDPRLGIFFLESGVRGAELIIPGIFQWLSAVWILLLGLMLLFGRPLVKTYIVSEIILSIPSIFFFLAIVWVNLSPAHGFSVGELSFPVLVMIAFSVVPLVLAFRIRKKAPGVELSNPPRA